MVFSSCHPLVRDNEYDAIEVDEEKQKVLEKSMLEQFQAELFRSDQYFYIVDSACNERELQDVILKGPAEKSDENWKSGNWNEKRFTLRVDCQCFMAVEIMILF